MAANFIYRPSTSQLSPIDLLVVLGILTDNEDALKTSWTKTSVGYTYKDDDVTIALTGTGLKLTTSGSHAWINGGTITKAVISDGDGRAMGTITGSITKAMLDNFEIINDKLNITSSFDYASLKSKVFNIDTFLSAWSEEGEKMKVDFSGADTWRLSDYADLHRAGTGNDTVYGYGGNDKAYGEGGNDYLSGGDGADYLNGGADNDSLFGSSGNDSLYGSTGNDTLTGGAGADYLEGNSGNDRFVFTATDLSFGTNADTLGVFNNPGAAAGDIIDLAAVDANLVTTGDQAFRFGSKAIGGLWAVDLSGGNTMIYGNLDSDSVAEFTLTIKDGDVKASAYTAADFIL